MDTTWQRVSKWYNKSVGDEGHYYHQNIILPKLLNLMKLKQGDKVLDIACGQGVFARALNDNIEYLGFDGSADFINIAKQKVKKGQKFLVQDATKNYNFHESKFTKVIIVLALQNIEKPEVALKLASEKMLQSGKMYLVLNHPFFRIPKASSWGWDSGRKLQYRIVNKYLAKFSTKIVAHPGEKVSPDTVSFHHSLGSIVSMLTKAGLAVEKCEEWVSDKKSTGGRARAENISRREIPLFMTIVARKI